MLQLTLDFQKLMHTFDAFLDSCLTECSRKVPLDGKDAGMDALFKLVFTKLSCKCSPRIGKLLSKLVVELLKKACSRDRAGKNDEGDREFFSECFVDSLDFYTRFNPSISASDMLVSKSEVLEGICMTLSSTGSVSFPAKLIDPPHPTPLCTYSSSSLCFPFLQVIQHDRASNKRLQFMVLKSSIDDFSAGVESGVQVHTSEDYHRVTDSFESVVQQRLERLKMALEVNAVISTVKFSNKVKMLANQMGMELFFCPNEDEVHRLCSAFGMLAQGGYSCGATSKEDAKMITSCGQFRVMSRGATLILNIQAPCHTTGEAQKMTLQTILLCAPTPASCSQYTRLLNQSLKLVRSAVIECPMLHLAVVPGACFVEKRLLGHISDALLEWESSAEGSLALGLGIFKEMVKGPLNAASANILGHKKLLMVVDPNNRHTHALNLLNNCPGAGTKCVVSNPIDLGILHPACYYKQTYDSALQVVHQLLRLMPR